MTRSHESGLSDTEHQLASLLMQLQEQAKKHDAAPPVMPNVQPADHIAAAAAQAPVEGPTIVHDPHAPTPLSTGHTDPVLPAGHKPSGDDQA